VNRSAARFDAMTRWAAYAALALFAASAVAHVYVYYNRPSAPFPLDGLVTPQTLQVFGPARTIYLRTWEADGLRALTTVASFALLIGALGAFRTRRRKP